MMRSIRIAMRQQDWHKVDSILTKNLTLCAQAPHSTLPCSLPTSIGLRARDIRDSALS